MSSKHDISQSSVNELIESALPDVKRIVQRTSSSFPQHVDKDELYGAGCLGLVEAAQRFDPSRGFSFSSWAEFRIKGAVLDYARSQDRLSQVARRDARKLTLVTESFVVQMKRPPTIKELADMLEWTPQKVQDTRANLEKGRTVSMSATANTQDNENSSLEQQMPQEMKDTENVENEEIYRFLRQGVVSLEPRQRAIVEGIFVEGLPMKDIAENFGLSISRVAQIRNDALETLRVSMMECIGDEIIGEYYQEKDFNPDHLSKKKRKERDRIVAEMKEVRSNRPPTPVPPRKPSKM